MYQITITANNTITLEVSGERFELQQLDTPSLRIVHTALMGALGTIEARLEEPTKPKRKSTKKRTKRNGKKYRYEGEVYDSLKDLGVAAGATGAYPHKKGSELVKKGLAEVIEPEQEPKE